MKLIAQNKKARFEYEIIKTYEAGIVLVGSEIKSIRNHKMNIQDSFGKIINGEVFLINGNIAPYKHSSYFNHDATRMRKLLLNKKEISKLIGKIQEKGMSLIPLKIYFNAKNRVKVEIALAKGKKLYDKRQTLKERDIKQKMDKEIKKNSF